MVDFIYTLAHATLFIDYSSSFNVLFPLFSYNSINIQLYIQQFHMTYRIYMITAQKSTFSLSKNDVFKTFLMLIIYNYPTLQL